MHSGPGAVGSDLDMAVLVAAKHAVAALVALLAEPSCYGLRAHLAYCATGILRADE